MDCKWYWLAKQKRVRFCELVFRGVDGIWTRDEGFADPCLTTWPRRHLHNEDCWLNYFQSAILHVWAGDGIRTHDLLLGKETYYHCTTPAEYRPAYCVWPRVPRPRIELGTPRFSVACSTNWAISAKCFVVKRPWFYTQLYVFVKKSYEQYVLLLIVTFPCLTFYPWFDIILGRCPKGQLKLFYYSAK